MNGYVYVLTGGGSNEKAIEEWVTTNAHNTDKVTKALLLSVIFVVSTYWLKRLYYFHGFIMYFFKL